MKIIIIYIVILIALPALLQAQYTGGNGRGDVSVSYTNVHILIHNITTEVPTKYDLAQNYPNPFNPVTNLEFGISDLGFVSLKVYDILGKEVVTLVNEKLIPGTYRVEFEAGSLTSGVYFYRLTSGDFTNTKRMLFVK
jgi:hypothetical protein